MERHTHAYGDPICTRDGNSPFARNGRVILLLASAHCTGSCSISSSHLVPLVPEHARHEARLGLLLS